MKKLSTIINTPVKATCIVTYEGEMYQATEEDIRHLQVLYLENPDYGKKFTVYDCDHSGVMYPMKWREDGKFHSNFTSNIFSFTSEMAMKLFRMNR